MTPRDRRALLWGALIVAAAVALRALPGAVRAVSSSRARLAERQATLARARTLIEAAPVLRDSLGRALASFVNLAPSLLEGRSRAEAAANLTTLMSLAAGRNALRVIQQDVTPDSVTGAFGRVTVRAQLEGDVSGLVRFFQTLETGNPLLTVGSLAIDAPEPQPRAGVPERLRVELEVSGWYLPREGP